MVQKAKVEINSFVGGLITDASPLTFPENTSLSDINMELNSDGSRQRTLGLDYETDNFIIDTIITGAQGIPTTFKTYRWENVAGDPEKVILCVQFGNEVKFFDLKQDVISGSQLGSITFAIPVGNRVSFAAIDGRIVIASGVNTITIGTYSSGVITFTTDTIRVRDFFGVEDFDGLIDMTIGTDLQHHPTFESQHHIYNLRNQSFGISRVIENNEILADPIVGYANAYNAAKGHSALPSNSDFVGDFLYADANDTDDRNSRRYFAKDAVKNPLGTTRAAQGYFIIDLLNRGTSRLTEDAKNNQNYVELVLPVTALPTDQTPGGATVVGEFAGRVWYGGFSGEVIDGDTKSPQLSSYVAFSQLVSNPSLITQCYQAGDPTSDIDPDIIDTDGGYIRINNAYGICGIVNLGKSLFICGANGIWRIFGGNDSGFSATNYVVEKITDKGVAYSDSIVQVENTLMYWSNDGIYWMKQNEFGDWTSENQTQGKIQKLYNAITINNTNTINGVYDSYQRKVKWLYNNRMDVITQQKELIFNVNLNAWYERHFSQVNGADVPIVVGGFNCEPFEIDVLTNRVFEIGYVVVTQLNPILQYTISKQTDREFIDWKGWDSVGVDAPSTLITGSASGGDNMRFKQMPYLLVHQRRTEDGFEGVDWTPKHQSSCTIRVLWDWANSNNSNKWSPPFQAYRYPRAYYPASVDDPFDTGFQMIISKNKVRGRGRAISIMFTSSPKKEMHLYGWSLFLSVNDNA